MRILGILSLAPKLNEVGEIKWMPFLSGSRIYWVHFAWIKSHFDCELRVTNACIWEITLIYSNAKVAEFKSASIQEWHIKLENLMERRIFFTNSKLQKREELIDFLEMEKNTKIGIHSGFRYKLSVFVSLRLISFWSSKRILDFSKKNFFSLENRMQWLLIIYKCKNNRK